MNAVRPVCAATDNFTLYKSGTPLNTLYYHHIEITVVSGISKPMQVETVGLYALLSDPVTSARETQLASGMQILERFPSAATLVTSAQELPVAHSIAVVHAAPDAVATAEAVESRAAIAAYFILSKFFLLIIKIVWINVYKHLRQRPYF